MSGSREVFRGRIITVSVEDVVLPNGCRLDMEIVHHPGGSAVVAVDDGGRVCLLRHYRPTVDEWLWELPAGKNDDKEPPLETARRELAEEAGVTAGRWDELGVIITSPGVVTERIHLYLARDLTAVARAHHPDEVFELHWLTLAEARARADAGERADAKTVIGLMRAQERMERA